LEKTEASIDQTFDRREKDKFLDKKRPATPIKGKLGKKILAKENLRTSWTKIKGGLGDLGNALLGRWSLLGWGKG